MVPSNQIRFYWRIIAVFVCLVWIIVLLINHAFNLLTFGSRIPSLVWYGFIGMTIIGMGILIYLPLQFYIYAGLCCFWGLINIINGGGLSGLLMYGLGLLFAHKMGFFKTHPLSRTLIAALVVLAALLFQIRYGIDHFMGSLLECLELFVIAGLIAALFHQKLAAAVKHQPEEAPPIRAFSVTDTELRLDRDHFTDRDLLVLQSILAGTKYDIIALEQRMGLSTLKKRLALLFSLLDVQDRLQFLERYEEHILVWRQPGGGDEVERSKICIICGPPGGSGR